MRQRGGRESEEVSRYGARLRNRQPGRGRGTYGIVFLHALIFRRKVIGFRVVAGHSGFVAMHLAQSDRGQISFLV